MKTEFELGNTPGPWTVLEGERFASFEDAEKKRNGIRELEIRATEPARFGGTTVVRVVEGAHDANARLMAASPVMYAALKRALPVLERVANEGPSGNSVAAQIRDDVRAAIAYARKGK